MPGLKKPLKKITAKTKAILVVHLYGQAAQMDQICDIAKKHGLEITEDCAPAFGSTFKGKKVGTFGKRGAYSFYPTKNLGAIGDGSAIVTKPANFVPHIGRRSTGSYRSS